MLGGAPSVLTMYLCLGVSAVVLTLMHRRGGGSSTLFYLGCFYALFAFGPVVNYLVGNDIYFGIKVENLDRASVGFAVAIAGLAAADRVVVHPAPAPSGVTVPSTRRYTLYPIVMVGLIAYGAVTTLRLLPLAASADKLQLIAAAGGIHSPYLVLELCAVSTYFVARRSELFSNLWLINLVTYVAYCLVTSERDFLFVIFSVYLHRQIVHNRRGPSGRVVAAALGFTLTASFLFASRAGERLDVAGVLNQGSIPFVDTFVIDHVSTNGFTFGDSYFQAVRSLPPPTLYDSGSVNLSTWLVDLYAPGSPGGYGFSLSGEAYMNFGLLGVFAVFMAVGLLVRTASRRVGTSDWGTYMSVYITAVTMYAFRVDSAQLLKSLVYGVIFFAGIGALDAQGGRRGTTTSRHEVAAAGGGTRRAPGA